MASPTRPIMVRMTDEELAQLDAAVLRLKQESPTTLRLTRSDAVREAVARLAKGAK